MNETVTIAVASTLIIGSFITYLIAELLQSFIPKFPVIYPTPSFNNNHRQPNQEGRQFYWKLLNMFFGNIKLMAILVTLVSVIALSSIGSISLFNLLLIALAIFVAIIFIKLLVYILISRNKLGFRKIDNLLVSLQNSGTTKALLENPMMSRIVAKSYGRLGEKYLDYSSNGDLVNLTKSGLVLLQKFYNIPEKDKNLRQIKSLLRLNNMTAKQIMSPRPDIVAVEKGSTIEEVIVEMQAVGLSKLPVYEKTLDNVVGIIHARDVLQTNYTKPDKLIDDYIRKHKTITEYQPVTELLEQFQQNRVSIAIVTDEHGAVSGLVTVTDLVEEIVGELLDEFDDEPKEIEKIDENRWKVLTSASLAQISDEIGTVLDVENIDTAGGLIYKHLGRTLETGSKIKVSGIEFKVLTTFGRRIREILVTK